MHVCTYTDPELLDDNSKKQFKALKKARLRLNKLKKNPVDSYEWAQSIQFEEKFILELKKQLNLKVI